MSSLLADARYLATRAIELEALLSRLADHGYDDTTADDEAVRRALVSARDQRVLACRLLTSLGGRPAVGLAPDERRATTVVVADDDTGVREVVARVLRTAGLVVRTAENGLEALIAAVEAHPDLIVMDIAMPVLDGIEATRLMKSAARTHDVKVIAHTSDLSAVDAIGRRWFTAVVMKPASPSTVLAAVREAAARDTD